MTYCCQLPGFGSPDWIQNLILVLVINRIILAIFWLTFLPSSDNNQGDDDEDNNNENDGQEDARDDANLSRQGTTEDYRSHYSELYVNCAGEEDSSTIRVELDNSTGDVLSIVRHPSLVQGSVGNCHIMAARSGNNFILNKY